MSELSRRSFLSSSAALAACARSTDSVPTVTGNRTSLDGPILAHEHIITDLRPFAERSEGDFDRDHAITTCLPHLNAVKDAGCSTIFDPSPMYTRHNPEVLRELSERSGLDIVIATGIYGAANQRFVPDYAHEESAEALADRYRDELAHGIKSTGIRPALIKAGVNREVPLPPVERKLVEAAFRASATEVSGGSLHSPPVAIHTGPALAVYEEIEIRDRVAPDASFAWVHAQNERDLTKANELARQNVWVSYDGISPRRHDWILECVRTFADAGLLGHVLLSQDAGWYRPGQADQSKYRGYTYLLTDFLPALRDAGFSEEEVRRLVVENPIEFIFGRPPAA